MAEQSTGLEAIATVSDLMPNEHILNFYQGLPTLPTWLEHPYNLILGSGDEVTNGKTNIEYHSAYNIFVCLPWNHNHSLRRNIEYLLSSQNHTKILCFMDIQDPKHIEYFLQLFKGSIDYIGYDKMQTGMPRFTAPIVAKMLAPGGIATYQFPPVAASISQPFEKLVQRLENDKKMSAQEILYTAKEPLLRMLSTPVKDDTRNIYNGPKAEILLGYYKLFFDKLVTFMISKDLEISSASFLAYVNTLPLSQQLFQFRNIFDLFNEYLKEGEKLLYIEFQRNGSQLTIVQLVPSIESYLYLTSGREEFGFLLRKDVIQIDLDTITETTNVSSEDFAWYLKVKKPLQELIQKHPFIEYSSKPVAMPAIRKFIRISKQLVSSSQGGKRRKRQRNRHTNKKRSRKHYKK